MTVEGTPQSTRSSQVRGRWLRRSLGVVILVTGLSMTVPALYDIQSSSAVINIPVYPVQSPISGIVQGFEIAVGQSVTGELSLGKVENTRARERATDELKVLDARLEGLTRQRTQWERQIADLQRRAQRHSEHQLAYISEQLVELSWRLAGQQAQVRQDRDALKKLQQLADSQFVSPIQVDGARHTLEGSEARLESIRSTERMLKIEQRAIQDRVYFGDGRNDVPYTQQKLEDLRQQIAELSSRIQETQTQGDLLRAQLDQTQNAQQVPQVAPIHSPGDGLVWRKFATNGSEVLAGSALAQIIDCRDAFLEVAIPEDQLISMSPGTSVSYRLIGSDKWLPARVRSTSGSGNITADTSLAAQLVRERSEGRIVVDFNHTDLGSPENNLCYVGRRVDVKVPRQWNLKAWFSRLHLFDRL